MIGSTGPMGPRRALHGFAGDEEGKGFDPKIVRRLLPFLHPYRRRMFAAIVMTVGSTGFSLLAPYLLKVAIDRDIASGNLPGLAQTCILLIVAYGGLFVSDMGSRYQLSWVGQRVLASLRDRLFTHLQMLHLGYHDRHTVGVTVSRVINDVGVINDLLSQGLVTLVGDSLLLAGTVAIMLSLDVSLALLCFTVIPVMLIATRLFALRAKSAFRRTRKSVASVVGDLAEDISGMRVIQAFAQESQSRERFDRLNQDNRNANIRAVSLSFTFLPTVDFLGVVASAIVLMAGGLQVAHHAVTIGVVVAFLSYVGQFFQPVRELSQIYNTAQSAMAGGEQILALLDTEPALTDPKDGRKIGAFRGEIEFAQVDFSYQKGVSVLHNLSFRFPAGSTTALVGPTGAGKSSIANLIARFYDPDSGAVLVDGTDIRTVTAASYRSQIAVVPQDPFLFAGTVLDNVRFGLPSASAQEAEEACRKINADSFIRGLPSGYQTLVQEGSANLSIGQRQLICIARAVIGSPRIIIFDEATANIDSVTEMVIQRALEVLLEGRTAVVIAHRLSTVRTADRILVVDAGAIVQEGTHSELLAREGLYHNLYYNQVLDQARRPPAE